MYGCHTSTRHRVKCLSWSCYAANCMPIAYSYNYRTNPTVEDVESLDKASLSDEIGPLTQENRKCPCDSCEDGTAAICFCLSCGLKYCDKHQQVMKHLKYCVITDIAQSPTLGSIMSQFFNIEKMSTIGYCTPIQGISN
mgnify:CR=1 FL=1